MLNEYSPAIEFKKSDITKAKKLEAALAKLKSGEKRYYSITQLSRINSLCQHEIIQQYYCSCLSDCVQRQLDAKAIDVIRKTLPEHYIPEWMHDIAKVMSEMRSGQDISHASHDFSSNPPITKSITKE